MSSGHGQQRAFTQKLSKQHAADVRRNIAYSGGKPNLFSNTNSYCSGWSGDVIEPLDYEDFLAQHHMLVERDPLTSILDFPIGDVEVAILKRHIRTLEPVVPEEDLEDLAPHVQCCVRCFTSDWNIIKYLHRQYSSSVCVTGRIFSLSDVVRRRQEFEIDFQLLSSSIDIDSSELSSSSRQSLVSSCSTSGTTTDLDIGTDNTLTPRNSWASFDLRNSMGDPLIPELLERISPECIDQLNESRRQASEARQECLFAVYPVHAVSSDNSEEPIERRLLAEPPHEHLGHRVLVKCLQLKLEIEVEPIFATMALYDAKEKKKLSENFYFDMNSENVKRMLGGHIPFSDLSTLSRSCIFNITHPSPDLFIVVRLEKVLQGDINECVEPYMKDDKINRQKVKENAVMMCERLGKYRQAFAWTAIYLMNVINGISTMERDKDADSTTSNTSTTTLNSNSSNSFSNTNSLERKISNSGLEQLRRRATDMGGSLTRRGSLERSKCSSASSSEKRRSWSPEHFSNSLDTFRPLTVTVSSFFKLESERLKDEDLYKFLQELKRPCQVMKKLKCIPGFLKLDISPCPYTQQQQTQDIKYCLSPELNKLIPYPDDKSRPIKELIEFPLRDILLPHYSYRNLLYVSPKELNFSNRTGSARNIAVKIQLMSGESEQNALSNIFGKSSCPEFTTEAYTSVTYHSKTPIFYDEIKMKLPATLGDQHHLLFTFYHISCQRKETQTTVDTPVGYTWLPLFKDNCLVTGEFCLPVMLEPPPLNYRYIPPEVCLPGTKWLDNHKGLFTVYLDSISSIHTQDKYIENFFKIYNQLESGNIPNRCESNMMMETELRTAMNELAFAKPEALVKHLCVIFDILLKMMVQPPILAGHVLSSVAHTTFETICKLLQNISTTLPDLAMDQHGRLSILATYIQYQCTLPFTLNTCTTSTSAFTFSETPDLEVERINTNTTSSTCHQQQTKMLHQELVLQWVVSSGAAKELAMSNAWFLFDIIIKSMVEYLHHHQQQLLNEPRKIRFPEQFTDDVTTLVHMVTSEIIGHLIVEPRLANQLNAALAFFLFDLVSIADRGYVLNLVRAYCKQMSAKISSLPDAIVSLVELKLDFLRIICSHEHYVALNLPFGTPYTTTTSSSAPVSPSPSIASSASQTSFLSGLTTNTDNKLNVMTAMTTYAELSLDYRQQHYLTGLLLSDLTIVLEMQIQNNNHLHSKVISMIRNLLTCHDSDPRLLSGGPEYKMRVASLYIPLLQITMDALPLLYYWQQQLINTSNVTSADESINQNVALAIAGKISYLPINYNYNYNHNYDSGNIRKYGLNAEQTRHLLICVLWILKNLHSNVLNQWLSELPTTRLVQFLQVLDVSITCFEYKGKKEIKRCNQQSFHHKTTDIKSKLEDVILGHQGSARSEMMQRRKERIIPINTSSTSTSSATNTMNNNEKLRWRKEQMIWRSSSSVDCTDSRPRDQIEADVQLEGTLATEATFIILDAVERVVTVVAAAYNNNTTSNTSGVSGVQQSTTVVGWIFKLMLHALARNQSTAVLPHLFATQRSLVFKFHGALFDEETEQCADLCLLLLKHCGSVIATVRTQAAASLYLLMRQTFEIGNNFARIKMQVTISLSSLVGTNTHFNEEYLKRSLKTILEYAERDVELQDTTFPEQVHDLIFNLHMILSDTVKMKEFQEDPEMLLDLMYRIAKGYQNSPDLRLTWLASMAQKHMERNNHSEAGMCLVHSAALVAEYVAMLEPLSHLPAGAVSLESVSPNVLAESAVSDDVLSPEQQEGVCLLGSHFTEAGLLGLLEHAASSFQQAAMYEPMNDIYKVLIPIAEHNRDFKKLANIHGKLHEAYTRIDQLQGKRVFGTYFRVGFYGDMFGDHLDQQEFIYKEPTLTKLPEIFSRLEKLYAERFGAENVIIIKDSNTVDVRQLDAHKAYIQITYVEPYFEPYELRYRQTHFDRNFNIKRFVYSTPFTASGRPHGELHEQFKRKTILTTAHHFPYVKTRIQVVERTQLTLSPIEVAIEDIQKKTAELVCATVQEPPDPKILQMVLQGCIGTTVNQGPMEMALVFLSDKQKQPLSKHQNKLRLCFKDFSKRCQDALRKNKNLITVDQRDYQRELERNYRKFTERLQPLII